jgi:hypothetical protein
MLRRSLLLLSVAACGAGPKSPPAVESSAKVLAAPSPTASTGAREEAAPSDALSFEIVEGKIQNRFYRRGKVAAHVLASSGNKPRLLFTFPAGNMGAGLWFDPAPNAVKLTMRGALREVERPDGLRGVSTELHAGSGSLHVQRLALAGVRVMRDVEMGAAVPEKMAARFTAADGSTPVLAKRTTVDGQHHLELDVEPLDGTKVTVESDGSITLSSASEIGVRLTALADDTPLTPVAPSELLSPAAGTDRHLIDVLSFLSYREKFLAGSWHYLTYFGRDTLLSTRLLIPALRPTAVEAALGSVIERLSPDGEVAHEEDVGEFAVAENLADAKPPADKAAPRYDYKMVDDDFLLASVLDEYLSTAEGKARRAAFFAQKTSSGRTYGDAVKKNLARVVKQATPFADKRTALSLVAIERGRKVGNWRDSEKGLAGGIYPYDVNVALVPAALQAAAHLTEGRRHVSGSAGALSEPDDALADAELSGKAKKLLGAWTHMERFFRVDIPEAEAKKRVTSYAKELGIAEGEAVSAITGPVTLRGVSLDSKGAAIPVMSSDDGFVMLFGAPDANFLEEIVRRIAQPFPLGLRTPVGMVVANPALSPDLATRNVFGRKDYHGTVVWSWQQALLAAGVKRQLARTDLTPKTRTALERAEDTLWVAIDATKALASAELWTFRIEQGKFVRLPFGQEAGHDEEANAAQLWSTVYLGVRPPSAMK